VTALTAPPSTAGAVKPRATVIVPVRDRRDLLAELRAALDAQTCDDFEVIVVDDGSTDGAGTLARESTVRGRPVRVLHQDGAGAVAARALAAEHAAGRVLAFTDSDCRPAPGWLAAGLGAIDAGADVVHGPTRAARPVLPLERSVDQADDGLFATCNVFYRREAFDAAGGFDGAAADRLGFRHTARARGVGFGEDTLLGWRVSRAGVARFEPEALVEHHVFRADLSETLNRSWMAAAFPALLREVPELRQTFVRKGVLFGGRSRLPVYAAAGAILTRRRSLLAGALAWWLAERLRDVRHQPISWPERLRAVPAEMLVDVVTAGALLAGSARHRTLLL
jgi:glycosyltransferase involved in cell wall biosynthesis